MGNEEKKVDYRQKRIRNDDMVETEDSESTETESE